jgi:hypothetical protein
MHFAINQARVLLLTKLIDTCLASLSYHISVVLSNKGLDLKNISPMELAQMKSFASVGLKQFRLLKEMQTAKFHATLRKYTSKLQDFHRDFIAPTTKLWVEGMHTDIKEGLLKQFLFRKRRLFLEKLTQNEVLTLEAPVVTLEEVQQFIKDNNDEERDPLRQQLLIVEDKVDHYYRTRNLPKWPFRKTKQQEATGEFMCPLLLLLQAFRPEDMLLILLSFADAVKFQQQQQLIAAAERANNNNSPSKKGKHRLLYDHAPGIDPHAGNNLGKTNADSYSSNGDQYGGNRGFQGNGSYENSSRSSGRDSSRCGYNTDQQGEAAHGNLNSSRNQTSTFKGQQQTPTKQRESLNYSASGLASSSRPSGPMSSVKSPNAHAPHRKTNTLSMSSSIRY